MTRNLADKVEKEFKQDMLTIFADSLLVSITHHTSASTRKGKLVFHPQGANLNLSLHNRRGKWTLRIIKLYPDEEVKFYVTDIDSIKMYQVRKMYHIRIAAKKYTELHLISFKEINYELEG